MKPLQQHILDRLAALREHREITLAELHNLEAEIPLIDAKIEENELLRKSLTVDTGPPDEELALTQAPEQRRNVRNGRDLGTTYAIFEFLENCDGPVRPVTVVNGIVDRIQTRSTQPRRMIFNTLHNLAKAGKVERTSMGRVRLPR